MAGMKEGEGILNILVYFTVLDRIGPTHSLVIVTIILKDVTVTCIDVTKYNIVLYILITNILITICIIL